MREKVLEHNRSEDEVFQKSRYWQLLGLRVLDDAPGRARLVMPVEEKLTQLYGTVHGGAIASLVDSAVAAALRTGLEEGDSIVTVEMKLNYLAPVRDGSLIAEAEIVHRGRTLAVGKVDVKNNDGRLVAFGVVTYMIIKKG